jgi:hypothetical protein
MIAGLSSRAICSMSATSADKKSASDFEDALTAARIAAASRTEFSLGKIPFPTRTPT